MLSQLNVALHDPSRYVRNNGIPFSRMLVAGEADIGDPIIASKVISPSKQTQTRHYPTLPSHSLCYQ